jgi:hypothetical protein
MKCKHCGGGLTEIDADMSVGYDHDEGMAVFAFNRVYTSGNFFPDEHEVANAALKDGFTSVQLINKSNIPALIAALQEALDNA